MLGLKRGTVILCDHTPRWEKEATAIIERIKQVLGDTAVDVRHIGSTSVRNLKAKPIVDLAIGVRRLEDMDAFTESLSAIGVYKTTKRATV